MIEIILTCIIGFGFGWMTGFVLIDYFSKKYMNFHRSATLFDALIVLGSFISWLVYISLYT